MVRIAGTDIPDKKRIEFALPYVYGLGHSLSVLMLKEVGVDKNKKTSELTPDEISKIRSAIEKKHNVEGDLRRSVSSDIKRLRDINSYRGSRHKKSLPVRGQRTKTNSRTAHGNVRKTATSGKRKVEKK